MLLDNADDDEGDEDDEDDEETLQLKLQAIQAQLKLKKLQKGKARKDIGADAPIGRAVSALGSGLSTTTTTIRSATSFSERTASSYQANVQVPASPVRRNQHNMLDPTSPSRVRLGIDKGLTARDISLKRGPSLKRPTGSEEGHQRGSSFTGADSSSSLGQPMSFGQRMQAARLDEASRVDRQARLKQVRTTAFGIGKNEIEDLKKNAIDLPELPEEPVQFSREDVLSKDQGRKDRATKEVGSAGTAAIEPYSGIHLSKRIIPHTTMARTLSGKEVYNIQDVLKHVKAPEFELPDIEKDIVIFGILATKSDPKAHKAKPGLKEKAGQEENPAKYMILKLVDLQWELDLFLFNTGFDRYWKLSPGTVLAILNPTIMPPPPGRTDTGKFSLVINNGDDTILEVGTARDLGFCKSIKKDGKVCDSWVNKKRTEFCEFHMNAALDKKLKSRQDINAFNTGPGPRSGSSAGGSRRGGKSMYSNDGHREDNRVRGSFDRETQSHWFLHKKDSAAAMLDNEVLSGHVTGTIERGEALKRRLATAEKERDIMKQLGKVGAGAGKEYMRLAQQKRELPASGTAEDPASTYGVMGDGPRRVDARSLGLLKGKDHEIHLSPVKRKRTESALSGMAPYSATSAAQRMSALTSTTSSVAGSNSKKEALGWGGGLRSKLSRMKEGENLRKGNTSLDAQDAQDKDENGTVRSTLSDQAPSRKKTRFVTEKGIRIAGRESLGDDLIKDLRAQPGTSGAGQASKPRMIMLDDDDDDDLLILDE